MSAWVGLYVVLSYWELITGPWLLIVGQAGVVVSVAWTGARTYAKEQLPEVPFPVFLGSIVGAILWAYIWLQGMGWWPSLGGVEILFSVPVGIVCWFLGMVFVSGITASVMGIDREERKRERTGDQYGDKHANRILDDNE